MTTSGVGAKGFAEDIKGQPGRHDGTSPKRNWRVPAAGFVVGLLAFTGGYLMGNVTEEPSRPQATALSDDYERALIDYLNARNNAIAVFPEAAKAGVNTVALMTALDNTERLATPAEVRQTIAALEQATEAALAEMRR